MVLLLLLLSVLCGAVRVRNRRGEDEKFNVAGGDGARAREVATGRGKRGKRNLCIKNHVPQTTFKLQLLHHHSYYYLLAMGISEHCIQSKNEGPSVAYAYGHTLQLQHAMAGGSSSIWVIGKKKLEKDGWRSGR